MVRAFPLIANEAGGGKIYLGSRETDSYIIVADYWQQLVDILKEPKKVKEITKMLGAVYPHNFSSRVGAFRVKIMLLQMAKSGLIESIDGSSYGGQKVKTSFSRPTIVRVLFSPPFVWTYGVLLVWAIVGPLVNPDLRISYRDFFWDWRLSYSLGTFFVFSWILGLFHELAHYLVARYFGIRSKLSVSNRWFFLVLQTEHPNIYALERLKKMAIYGAGVAADVLVISLLNMLVVSGYRTGFLRQILLIEWLGVLWQFLFFMRTDIYFVIRELFGVENLYTKTKESWRQIMMGKGNSLTFGSKKERSTIVVYGVFMLLGAVVAIFRYVFYHIPILVTAVFDIYIGIRWGLVGSGRDKVVDGIVILAVEVMMMVVFLIVIARKKRIIS